jgi:hypothetical protein
MSLTEKYGEPKERTTETYRNGVGNEFLGAVMLWKADDSYIKAAEVCGDGIIAKVRKPAINFGAILAVATVDEGGCITFGDYKLTKELNANILKPQICRSDAATWQIPPSAAGVGNP